ncbi:peptide-methionine (S)-S-oxide reductase MsrA [bacterium]|nr:peptide-methionine (S)-S-oxide reductase MsrA [bacterium]
MEKSYFAAGCFWGVEASFKEVEGVVDTTCGYGGGHTENPSYRQVCDEETGHAEIVEVVFDPAKISFESLVRFFFTIHDPTTKNRQGPDVGTQYRSGVFVVSPEQKMIAEKVIRELTEQKVFAKPIVSEVTLFTNFYPAEEYHQDYLDKNPGMCHV